MGEPVGQLDPVTAPETVGWTWLHPFSSSGRYQPVAVGKAARRLTSALSVAAVHHFTVDQDVDRDFACGVDVEMHCSRFRVWPWLRLRRTRSPLSCKITSGALVGV